MFLWIAHVWLYVLYTCSIIFFWYVTLSYFHVVDRFHSLKAWTWLLWLWLLAFIFFTYLWIRQVSWGIWVGSVLSIPSLLPLFIFSNVNWKWVILLIPRLVWDLAFHLFMELGTLAILYGRYINLLGRVCRVWNWYGGELGKIFIFWAWYFARRQMRFVRHDSEFTRGEGDFFCQYHTRCKIIICEYKRRFVTRKKRFAIHWGLRVNMIFLLPTWLLLCENCIGLPMVHY